MRDRPLTQITQPQNTRKDTKNKLVAVKNSPESWEVWIQIDRKITLKCQNQLRAGWSFLSRELARSWLCPKRHPAISQNTHEQSHFAFQWSPARGLYCWLAENLPEVSEMPRRWSLYYVSPHPAFWYPPEKKDSSVLRYKKQCDQSHP